MTTAQLTVLWYAVVVIELALGVTVSQAENPTISVVAAVALLATALIYTLSCHGAANRAKVARLVLIPVSGISLMIATILGIIWWRESRSSGSGGLLPSEKFVRVDSSKLEVFDVRLEWYHGGAQNMLSGRLRNASSKTVHGLGMTIELLNYGGKVIDVGVGAATCDIPPGETGGFSGYVDHVTPTVTRTSTPHLGSNFNPYTGMWETVDCTWRYSDVVALSKRYVRRPGG